MYSHQMFTHVSHVGQDIIVDVTGVLSTKLTLRLCKI